MPMFSYIHSVSVAVADQEAALQFYTKTLEWEVAMDQPMGPDMRWLTVVPPGAKTTGGLSRFDELVASGVIRTPLESGDPTEGWPDIRLPAGAAAISRPAFRVVRGCMSPVTISSGDAGSPVRDTTAATGRTMRRRSTPVDRSS